MAEARSEDDEENMRESREQVVRRPAPSSGGRPNRRKPEHRLSQGPLSSIRAAIKRTSTRSISLSETPPRDRERERERDRRRPEITILSAEPISSWFPGAGFPPPPPPAAQIWGPSLIPDIQPPPSYEEVIREKNQEQVIVPAAVALPPGLSASAQPSVCTTTIATQTEAQAETQVQRPLRPPKPSVPNASSKTGIIFDQSFSFLPNCDSGPSISTQTPSDLNSSLFSFSEAEIDQSEPSRQRPQPRPRSKINLHQVRDEVKVQTLVKLREDGLKTLAARANNQASNQEATGGKYLHELLEAFSSDDWGFPERGSASQSESDDEPNWEGTEQEQDKDMAMLRARIKAFEQMHDGNFEETKVEPCVPPKQRPEPKPRPRLPQNKPPIVSPKPQNRSNTGDFLNSMDCTEFLEDYGQISGTSEKSDSSEKTSLAPKPELNIEMVCTMPVPLPRPSPCLSQPKLPPRPSIVPRARAAGQSKEKSVNLGQATQLLPPRPTVDIRPRAKMETANGEESSGKTVKVGNPGPGVPCKPTFIASRRSSAPNLVSNLVLSSDPGPVPSRPSGPPRPALRKTSSILSSTEPSLPPRPTGVKLLPLRPPPMKSLPGRPPPPSVNANSNPLPSLTKSPSSPSLQSEFSSSTNQTQGQRATKKGPPLPPRPKPGHPLYSSYLKQEVLIIMDDPSPAPSEPSSQSDKGSSPISAPVTDSTPCLLHLDLEQDQNHKPALEGLLPSQEIVALESVDQKKELELNTISGPRCVALFDYSAVEEDELTFSRGDVIALLEVIGEDQDWGRGQLCGRIGIFPLNFTQTTEPLPTPSPTGEKDKTAAVETTNAENTGRTSASQESLAEEWAEAVFHFPGQTAGDLCFQKGALIRVLEHVDAEWRRGKVDDKEGLYPAAFTQPAAKAQPITAQHSETNAKVLFDFVGENEDELTLKVGDILTQVESVDEDWILGVLGNKRGIVPKNYISLLT